MATAAIDFGTLRTKIAVFDWHKCQPVVRANVPTLAYVPRSGPILVGEPAQKAIADDPTGTIDNLKLRMGGDDFLRNRRTCKPVELISLLFSETRCMALEQQLVLDPLTDCILTIPLHFDLRHGELLRDAARHAGFMSVSLIYEPVAAIRSWERKRAIPEKILVVCDVGYTARISVLRQIGEVWQPDLETLPTPVPTQPYSSLPSLLFDSLRSLSSEMLRGGMINPPLLVVGGGAIVNGIGAMLKQEGWPGEILVPDNPDVAMVLGAIDITAVPREIADATTCPEAMVAASSLFAGNMPFAPVSLGNSESELIAPDGTLLLSDYHIPDLTSIVAASIPLFRNGRVNNLHLLGEDWDDKDVKQLRRALLPQAKDDWHLNWQKHIEYVQGCLPSLSSLEITSCERLSSGSMLELSSLANLTSVDLSNWRVRESAVGGIQELVRLPRLKSIKLPVSLPSKAGINDSWRDLLRKVFCKINPNIEVL